MKKPLQMTCYLSPDERRAIDELAGQEERPASQVVQFAIRAFRALYRQDRDKALQLAQAKSNSQES